MQEKRKKFWIRFGIIVAVVVAFVFISLKVTSLKSIFVEFVTRQEDSQLPEGIADDIVANGNFEYGKSLMFVNFNKKTEEIEKKYPYVEVVQVIREFPNRVRIRISERIPYFRVQDETNGSRWYILDDEYKVLKIIAGDPANEPYADMDYKRKTIELKDTKIASSTQEGDFVKNIVNREEIADVLSGIKMVANAEYSFVDSIQFSDNDGAFTTNIYMKESSNATAGFLITFEGKGDIKKKTQVGIDLFNQDEVKNSATHYIYIFKAPTGEYKALLAPKTN